MKIDSFLPLAKTISQWSDRKKTIFKPLFPSYVFVNINSSLEFQNALSVDGAFAYIRFGSKYARVTQKEINQIKNFVGDQNISDITTNSKPLEVGEIRKIVYGPMCGMECKVIEVSKANKVIVQIDLLQNIVTASIPAYYF